MASLCALLGAAEVWILQHAGLLWRDWVCFTVSGQAWLEMHKPEIMPIAREPSC